jgi:hypothetical protein
VVRDESTSEHLCSRTTNQLKTHNRTRLKLRRHVSLQRSLMIKHIFELPSSKTKWKLCYDRWSGGQSILVSSPHLRSKTRLLLRSDRCGYVDVRRPLRREDRSVVNHCCWPSPTESFSGLSSAGLMTIFYCLRFDTPQPGGGGQAPNLYPPGTGRPSYTPKHWRLVRFSVRL